VNANAIVTAGLILALVTGCSGSGSGSGTSTSATSSTSSTSTSAPAAATSTSCDLSNFLAVQHAHVNHAEVTLCGTVARTRRARRTRSGVHKYVWVDVGHGNQIEIDLNLDEMGRVPVMVGESAVVRGEYYYDDNGREGVHWTHHTDRGSHPPAYVILNGTQYQ
jgi:hypothetical protein